MRRRLRADRHLLILLGRPTETTESPGRDVSSFFGTGFRASTNDGPSGEHKLKTALQVLRVPSRAHGPLRLIPVTR